MKSKQYSGSAAVKLKKLFTTTKFSKEKDAKPVIRQSWEMLLFWLARGFIPREYFRYQFYKKNVTLGATQDYLSYKELRRYVYPPKNALSDRWKNKGVLYAELAEEGFPVPENIGILNPFDINKLKYRELDKNSLKTLLEEPVQYVLKPTELSEGRGIYFLNPGEERINSPEQVLNKVKNREYLLQRYVNQHPLFNRIYPHSVNTLRIVSFNHSGAVFIWGAVLRVGLDGNKTDNWHGGGLGIKVEGGKLREGVLVKGAEIMFVKRHPTTGFEFFDLEIPFWSECIEVVKRGARAFADTRAIGWDVAVTENGPLILEANVPFGAELLQMTQKGAFRGEVKKEWVVGSYQ